MVDETDKDAGTLFILAGYWMKAKPIIATIQFNTTNLEIEEDKDAALSIVSDVITIPCGHQRKQHHMYREAAPYTQSKIEQNIWYK